MHTSLADAIRRALRPLVGILLRNGVAFGEFSDYAKQAYVDAASRDLQVPGRKPTTSRISVLTGLTRKEVSRIRKRGASRTLANERYNRAARVIGAWVRESDFHDARNRPAALTVDEGPASFSELVRRFGGDVPTRAVLDELLRVGSVERRRDGKLRLVERAYVPSRGEEEKLAILGVDVADLVASIDHNLTHPPEDAFFQRKVAYDHLVSECLPELRDRVSRRGQALLETLDRFMNRHDRDANPVVRGSSRHRAVLGIYYYEHPVSEED